MLARLVIVTMLGAFVMPVAAFAGGDVIPAPPPHKQAPKYHRGYKDMPAPPPAYHRPAERPVIYERVEPRPVACSRKLYVPEIVRTVREDVLVAEASCVRRVIPAVYGWQARAVIVAPERVVAYKAHGHGYGHYGGRGLFGHKFGKGFGCGGCGYAQTVAVPPTYGLVRERVILEPEHMVEDCRPAVYNTIERQVVVVPARWEVRRVEPTYSCGGY